LFFNALDRQRLYKNASEVVLAAPACPTGPITGKFTGGIFSQALTPSLFAGLGQDRSGVNLLIGSRRLAEGWDNYRASSLTLPRLGQGEGASIIQMVGRVVRFAGHHGDGKRLDHPPAELRSLQTAYVYGLRSTYLEIFLNGLLGNLY
jgi:hypothetical protein